jgi:hypothetical protein
MSGLLTDLRLASQSSLCPIASSFPGQAYEVAGGSEQNPAPIAGRCR